jgi:hypothetical protein
MDTRLNEVQMGFCLGRSCSNALFTINQLTNWSREHMQPLFACFVDLKKAYDCINRYALWYVLGRQGVPIKLLELLHDLHMGSSATIKAFGGNFGLSRSGAWSDKATILCHCCLTSSWIL